MQIETAELRATLAAAAVEAASKPAVITSAFGAGLSSIGDWLSTGPGAFMAMGFALSVATFFLTLWKVLRDDRRAAQRHEAEIRFGK